METNSPVETVYVTPGCEMATVWILDEGTFRAGIEPQLQELKCGSQRDHHKKERERKFRAKETQDFFNSPSTCKLDLSPHNSASQLEITTQRRDAVQEIERLLRAALDPYTQFLPENIDSAIKNARIIGGSYDPTAPLDSVYRELQNSALRQATDSSADCIIQVLLGAHSNSLHEKMIFFCT